ncbi:hypothetical protein GCM10007876_18140 [Litoribrevibacter albus]|uniref:Uncharacterized protein n=2 Tax=Litoribrevibacter albus TaxID=1473156 RepID=A0AA37S8Z3_9GAMM|nr:hypothetical protein GCM10007876_18140 [Litoribrevibacter albus]
MFATLGGVAGCLLSLLLFYLAGQLWGPLYQGEDEATRNVKVFFGVTGVFLIVGLIIGYRCSNKE